MGKWYKLTDTDEMPFGKYKGIKMIDVPADYLLFIYNDREIAKGNVRDYILDNLEVLKEEENKSSF